MNPHFTCGGMLLSNVPATSHSHCPNALWVLLSKVFLSHCIATSLISRVPLPWPWPISKLLMLMSVFGDNVQARTGRTIPYGLGFFLPCICAAVPARSLSVALPNISSNRPSAPPRRSMGAPQVHSIDCSVALAGHSRVFDKALAWLLAIFIIPMALGARWSPLRDMPWCSAAMRCAD